MEKVVVSVFLIAFMLQAGLGCDFRDLFAALKNRNCMIRVVLANFIVVPIIGVAAVRVFALDDFIAVGVLLMAIAPGVPFLPMLAGTKNGGDEGLATALAVLLPAISIVTVPITAPLVLPVNAEAHIVLATFIVNLVLLQLLPLIIGLYVRERAPSVAPTLIKVCMAVVLVALIVVLVVLAPKMGAAFVAIFGTRGLMATLLIVLLSAGTGWLFGGSEARYRNTMTLSTMMRNFGLALLVTEQNFTGSVAGLAVLTYFVIQLVVANLLAQVLKRQQSPAAPKSHSAPAPTASKE
ncbi:MAG: bile acid:sodium symporter [Candidatus Aquilonibacter sp.]